MLPPDAVGPRILAPISIDQSGFERLAVVESYRERQRVVLNLGVQPGFQE